MKKNLLSILALILSIISITLSMICIRKLNSLSAVNTGQISEESINDESTTENNSATHPFDESLVGNWTNGGWNLEVMPDSSLYIEATEDQNKVDLPFLYIGYIENSSIIITQRCRCSKMEYLNNQADGEKEDAFYSANLIREATDSFRIKEIVYISPGLSFRRVN